MNFFRWILLAVMIIATMFSVVITKYFSLYQTIGFGKALDGFLLFSSITMGFFGTCISILATLINSKIVQEILGNKDYKIEFIAISILTIGTGFIGIVTTVVFQMLMKADGLKVSTEKII